MPRRALLIFAENARRDLARRKLPAALLPLLQFPWLRAEQTIAADLHVFHLAADGQRNATQFHCQEGSSFRARFENAIEKLSTLGYEEVVAIGRDCPSLNAADITQAFNQLTNKRLVLGPDHRGGCYLIAFNVEDRALLRGIRWKRNTDCAQLLARAGEEASSLLAIKHDLDSLQDLQLAARADQWIASLAAFVLLHCELAAHVCAIFVHAIMRFVRIHSQISPPVCAG